MQLLVILQSFPRLLPPAPLAGSLVATMRPWMDHSLLTIDQVDHWRPYSLVSLSFFLSLFRNNQNTNKTLVGESKENSSFYGLLGYLGYSRPMFT